MSEERLIIENMFRIPDKGGRDSDFLLNQVQSKLDSELTLRDIIPKARQRGISSYIVARFLAKCLKQRNRRCVVVSHTAAATTKLLDKANYILRNLKFGAKANLRYASRNELIFSETESVFYIGTAGTDSVGVGDTITDLHCSEPAFWRDPLPLLKGLFNAVPPEGHILIEGTGNGMGNWYHRQCMRAAAGTGLYKLHFFSWTDAEEYRAKIPQDQHAAVIESLDAEPAFEGEKALFENQILDVEQIVWRRQKIEEMDFDIRAFMEQYPLNLAECFQGTGKSYFLKINFQQTARWAASDKWRHFHLLADHPHPNHPCVAGVDVGSGAGLDATVLCIFCLQCMAQVGEWASNAYEPHRAAQQHKEILEAFHFPYLNVERNNHGILYIKEILNMFPNRGGWFHMSKAPRGVNTEYGKIADFGTFTSGKTRPEILGSLRKFVTKELIIHSPLLKAEMDSFVENDAGKLEAQEGCLDDRVLAASFATYVLPKAAARVSLHSRFNPEPNSPFQLEGILSELEGAFNRREAEG